MSAVSAPNWLQKFTVFVGRIKRLEAAIEYSTTDYLLDRLAALDRQVAELRAEVAAFGVITSEVGQPREFGRGAETREGRNSVVSRSYVSESSPG